jgi:hypothetical protein
MLLAVENRPVQPHPETHIYSTPQPIPHHSPAPAHHCPPISLCTHSPCYASIPWTVAGNPLDHLCPCSAAPSIPHLLYNALPPIINSARLPVCHRNQDSSDQPVISVGLRPPCLPLQRCPSPVGGSVQCPHQDRLAFSPLSSAVWNIFITAGYLMCQYDGNPHKQRFTGLPVGVRMHYSSSAPIIANLSPSCPPHPRSATPVKV